MANASVALSGQQAQQAAAAASGGGYDNTLFTGSQGAPQPNTTAGKQLTGQ
jgi:hypothetical protein